MRQVVKRSFKDGVLLTADQQKEEITEQVTNIPLDVSVAEITVKKSAPFQVFGYGGNAHSEVSISIQVPQEQKEIDDAVAYLGKLTGDVIRKEVANYKSWLDKQGIDWKLVDKQMKGK